MSAYECPGCGGDAPLSQECPRCEEEDRDEQGLLARLRATRAQLLQEMSEHTQSLAMLRDEARRERRMVENLRQDVGNLHIRLAAALSDADECRLLRDLAVKSLELRTSELLDKQTAFDEERACFVAYQRRLQTILRPEGEETSLPAIELAQVRMIDSNPTNERKTVYGPTAGESARALGAADGAALVARRPWTELCTDGNYKPELREIYENAYKAGKTMREDPSLQKRIAAAHQHLEACQEALRNEDGRGVRYDGLEEARDSAKEALQELLEEKKEASNAE